MSTVHRPLSVIFMGTPAFALPTLKALVRAQKREPALSSASCESQQAFAEALEIVAVYSQPPRPAGRGQKETPSPVHIFAEENAIPVFTPTSLKTAEAQAEFAAHKADIAVVVAYGLLLPKAILEGTKHGCINVHPSKLPRWRGAAPIQRTIMAGDHETSICIMQMDEGLDTGDILLEESYTIPDGMNAGTLHDALAEKAAPLVLKAIELLGAGKATRTPQAVEGVTYANKISKEECRINCDESAEKIYHHILGLSPSPGAYFEHQGEHIKIFDARYSATPHHTATGSILNNRMDIACAQGILHPLELQRPGKKRMKLDEFLKGFNAL